MHSMYIHSTLYTHTFVEYVSVYLCFLRSHTVLLARRELVYTIDLRVWQETKIGQLLTQSLLHNSEICAVFGQIELAQIFLKISNDLQFFKKGGILEYY